MRARVQVWTILDAQEYHNKAGSFQNRDEFLTRLAWHPNLPDLEITQFSDILPHITHDTTVKLEVMFHAWTVHDTF